MITVDSEQGKRWGFTSENFEGDSYLWQRDGVVIVSFIFPKRLGAFGELVRAIQADGFKVDVPTPLGQMNYILREWGAEQRYEHDEQMDCPVELWRVPQLAPRKAPPPRPEQEKP